MNKASAQLAVAESGHQASHPTFREAFRFWLKLGFVSFGGSSGQIAMMHAELVEKNAGSTIRDFYPFGSRE
jgi:chromate transport protein ChrA